MDWSKHSYGGHGCNQCKGNDEAYMLIDAIWKSAKRDGRQRFLCIKCVENNLGRALIRSDFTDALINFGIFGFDCIEYIAKHKK